MVLATPSPLPKTKRQKNTVKQLRYFTTKEGENMSCPHLKHSIISKSKGGSIIASSAYNRRKKMFDETENKIKYSHTRADDHVFTKMLLPNDAPKSYLDPYRIWNDLNKIEDDKVGYKLIIPFQRELSYEQNMQLAIDLLNEEYVSKGHPVQIDIHRGKGNNYHLHAIAADRRLIKGDWETQKSETIYYLKGTVKELDSRGKVINPDAVILTNADKVDTPKLRRKKLQYDKDGKLITEKGWQKLQYDSNGKPLLDENGYPVLVDIREPDYIPGTNQVKMSKNGKYLKPQFKKGTVKRSDVSDIGNIARLRKAWERLQNEYYKKYNVRDENNEIFSVDLRSYKEQNKERPADQQLIPTKHIGYGAKAESMINYNEDAKKHNELVKEIREKAQALRKEKQRLARDQKGLSVLQQDNVKFYTALNPRQLFINLWTAQYNKLRSNRKATEDTILQKLEAGRNLNIERRERIDRRNKKSNAAWNRLYRHGHLMDKVASDISARTNSIIDIATLAGKKFDTFTNKEIVAFIRAKYGYDTATVAADVLERTSKDNSNAKNGREEKPPYYPKNNTNDIILQQSINVIAKNPDIGAITKEAFATWDKTPDEAPPKGVMNALDSYYTAEEFYNSSLSGHTWNVVYLDKNYNPKTINKDYQETLTQIIKEEQAEAERKAKEAAAKAEAERKAKEAAIEKMKETEPEKYFLQVWQTKERRYEAAEFLCEKTESRKISYKQEYYDNYMKPEREYYLDNVIKLVAYKIPYNEESKIYWDAQKKRDAYINAHIMDEDYIAPPEIKHDQAVYNWLKSHSKKLESYADKYGYGEDYAIYKKWSILAKKYWDLGKEMTPPGPPPPPGAGGTNGLDDNIPVVLDLSDVGKNRGKNNKYQR